MTQDRLGNNIVERSKNSYLKELDFLHGSVLKTVSNTQTNACMRKPKRSCFLFQNSTLVILFTYTLNACWNVSRFIHIIHGSFPIPGFSRG